MLNGKVGTELLKTHEGVVRVLKDTVTESYSIGITTDTDFEWKYISKELYDLLVKELSTQEGKRLY
jgi:hypothetical protein